MFDSIRNLFGKPTTEATGIYKLIDTIKNPFDSFKRAMNIVKLAVILLIAVVLYKKFG